MQTLCEDLLMGAYNGGSLMAQVDDAALAALMAEVDDPALQATILDLATAAARADHHLAEGEALVLEAARRHWAASEVDFDLRVDDPMRLMTLRDELALGRHALAGT